MAENKINGKKSSQKENEVKSTEKKFIKIPQTPQRIKQNICLALGLVFLGVGIVLTASNFSSAEFVDLRPAIITIFVGGLCLFFGMGFIRSSSMVFFGAMFFLLGIPILLRSLEILKITIFQMIPYAMICAGIALFLSGLYRVRKIRSAYIFPSSALVILGIFFLLFSTGILRFSLTTFVSKWFPLLLLLIGIVLVVVFYVQQIRKKDFPYISEEESLEDEEDELSASEKKND